MSSEVRATGCRCGRFSDIFGTIPHVSAKNRVLLIVLLLLALVAVFVTLVFLYPANEQDSGVGPLQPDAMHQPSTN